VAVEILRLAGLDRTKAPHKLDTFLNRSADETRMVSCVRHVGLTWASV